MRRFGRFTLGARLALALAFAVGCDLFPPELYQRDGAPPDLPMRPHVELVDGCEGELPVIDQAVVNAPIDLSSFADDVSGVECTGTALPGNDAFFAVSMGAGERWHFHLSPRASLGFDPAVYVMASCGAGCEPGWAMDACRADQDEHLTVVAPADGLYVVGIDGSLPGGGVYDLLVSNPVCGNEGGPEHGETCDDGNTVAGDGCDERCRAELADGAREREPNDDPTGANVLASPSSVRGNIGGRCDVDFFVLEHSGGALALELRPEVGDCAEPSVELALTDPSGTTVALGTDSPGTCAALGATLAADTYLVRVWADPEAPDLPYVLQVD